MHPLNPWAILITLTAIGAALALSWHIWRTGVRLAQHLLARRLIIGIWLWLAIAVAASLIGFFENPARFTGGDLPGFLLFGTLMTIPPLLFLAGMRRNGAFRRLIEAIPTPWLAGLQVYRAAGVIFLALVAAEQAPFWWGISTGFADLLVGVAALPLARGLASGAAWARPAALVWNITGMADFANSIGYVFLAFFGVIAATPAPAMIGLHPLALVALFQVPLAIIIHGLLLRRYVHQGSDEVAAGRTMKPA